jgi:hypothetical protein
MAGFPFYTSPLPPSLNSAVVGLLTNNFTDGFSKTGGLPVHSNRNQFPRIDKKTFAVVGLLTINPRSAKSFFIFQTKKASYISHPYVAKLYGKPLSYIFLNHFTRIYKIAK